MRYLGIALVLILGLAACNMTTANQPEEEINRETIALPTNLPVATQPAAATRTPAPTNIPATSVAVAVLPSCTIRTDWQIYTVASGDTISQIAQRSGTNAEALASANCLSDANAISVGQALRVPSLPAPAPVALNNTIPATLRMVGDFNGAPSLDSCWAGNPVTGTKPLIYNAIDGQAIAYISNRVLVTSANPTWVQVHLNGTTTIPETTGWMRVNEIRLIGFCTEALGIQLVSSRGIDFGNRGSVPDGLCAVTLINARSARAYPVPGGEVIGELNGWGKWVSTQDSFYQFEQDYVPYLGNTEPVSAWVEMSSTQLVNC